MKVLIDTNIILDVLCRRECFFEDSTKILKLCEINRISGIISALSFPNIVYIMRKELDGNKIKEVLEKLSLILGIADLKRDDLINATNMDFNDYEDALQCACAMRVKADYIITRNIKDFLHSQVTAISPKDFLELVLDPQ